MKNSPDDEKSGVDEDKDRDDGAIGRHTGSPPAGRASRILSLRESRRLNKGAGNTGASRPGAVRVNDAAPGRARESLRLSKGTGDAPGRVRESLGLSKGTGAAPGRATSIRESRRLSKGVSNTGATRPGAMRVGGETGLRTMRQSVALAAAHMGSSEYTGSVEDDSKRSHKLSEADHEEGGGKAKGTYDNSSGVTNPRLAALREAGIISEQSARFAEVKGEEKLSIPSQRETVPGAFASQPSVSSEDVAQRKQWMANIGILGSSFAPRGSAVSSGIPGLDTSPQNNTSNGNGILHEEEMQAERTVSSGNVASSVCSRPGAVSVIAGSDVFDEEMDSTDFNDDPKVKKFSAAETFEVIPIDAPSTSIPTVFEAHVPEISRGDSEYLVVDAVHEPKAEGSNAPNLRRWYVVGGCILICVIIGSVVGAILGNRSGKSADSAITDPTSAPTSIDERRDAITSFLSQEISRIDEGASFEAGTLHSLAAEWIMNEDPQNLDLSSPRLLQRFALVLLYLQTTNSGEMPWERCNPPNEEEGEDDICLSGSGEARWLTGTDECTWFRVTCNEEFQVNATRLPKNNLSGPFPSALRLLTDLQDLDLRRNNLDASLPDWLYELTRLVSVQLEGSDNLKNSTISTLVGRLTDLAHLSFEWFNLLGTLPSQLGVLSNLTHLSIARPMNYGLVGSIPEEIYGLTHLTKLDLESNLLNGTISSRIGQLTALNYLLLDRNQLSGTIPTQMFRSLSLLDLGLAFNRLSGTLPSFVGNSFQLRRIDLYGATELTGTLPEELYNLRKLELLEFGETQVGGTISTKIGLLTNLLQIRVNYTMMTGTIPSEIGLLSSDLNFLFFERCRLSGTMPEELFDLTNLSHLSFRENNDLSGTMSTRIGELSDLQTIILTDTRAQGTLPTEIGLLTRLRALDLASSAWTGSIPEELGNLSSLERLDIRELPGITGLVPESFYKLTKLRWVQFDNTPLSGSINTLIGHLSKLTVLRYPFTEITGTIPTEVGRLTDLLNLAVAHARLTGTIPSEIGLLSKLTRLSLKVTELEGSMPDEVCDIRQPEGGGIPYLRTDCLPLDNPTLPCACCTHCCFRDTGECEVMAT